MHERVNRSFQSAAAIVIAATLALSGSAWAAPGAYLPLAAQPWLAAAAPAESTVTAAPAESTVTAKPASAAQPAKNEKVKKEKKPKVKQPPHVHTPDAGPWDAGALWITTRAGYNRATYRTAGDGNVGWGFGATHMINTGWSL